MKNLLAIDMGNTNITAGVFEGERLIIKIKIPTQSYYLYEKNFKRLLKKDCDIVISSVVPLALSRLVMHLNKISKCRMTILGKDVLVPIKNKCRVKSEVGQDRLVNAYAARELYGTPAIAVDFGTGITFDIVSRKGEYLGGLILPGIELSLRSLYKNTALLPKVKLKDAYSIIAKDTVSNMRGGILFGFGAMCDGLVAQYRKILGQDAKVIVAGGNARLMKKYAKSIRIVDEDLTLKGLLLISRRDCPIPKK